MLSNKDKRLSQALPSTSHDFNYPPSLDAQMNQFQYEYGLINARHAPKLDLSSHYYNGPSTLPTPAPQLTPSNLRLKQSVEDGNQLPLLMRQMHVSNVKNKNNTFTDRKNTDYANNAPIVLEEMNSYRKETQETKKQLFQIEKSLKYWSECTEYWRNKWQKCRQDKIHQREEMKQLRFKISKLEQQLQVSERKNTKLTDEATSLNKELSRYIQRFGTDRRVAHKSGSLQVPKRQNVNQQNQLSLENNQFDSNDEEDLEQELSNQETNGDHKIRMRRSNGSPDGNRRQQIVNSSKAALRQHERLFDKKIMNKKRFSQVVMVDEDEIMHLNEEIPIKDATTNHSILNGSMINVDNGNEAHLLVYQQQQQRFMEHLPEEEFEGEEEDDEDEEDEKTNETDTNERNVDSSEINNLKLISSTNVNHSNMSTMATNSECPNVGSIRYYGSDSDSRYVQNETPVKNALKAIAPKRAPDLVANQIEDYEDGEI